MADAGLIRDGSDDEDARPTSAAENEKTDAKTVTCQKRKPLYAELGAGRGYLSHFLLDAYGPLDLMLVEREAVRFKAERSMGAEADKRREAQTRDERRPARKETKRKTPTPTSTRAPSATPRRFAFGARALSWSGFASTSRT